MKSSRTACIALIIGACVASLSLSAYANGEPEAPPNPSAVSASGAAALAGATALAGSMSSVRTNVDVDANLVGGDNSADARAGSTNLIDASTVYERQVGTLIMGTVIPVDCGFGGQAGGANTNGSGFLGASWTTETCYALKVANGFAAVGEYEYACELWIGITSKFLKKRRGITNVDCALIGARLRAAHATPAPVVHVVSDNAFLPAGSSDYVTRAELQTAMDRAFKRAVGK